MSRIDNWDENERALYALGSRAILDDLDRARESMAAELDLYRDDWSTRYAEMTRAHNERMQRMHDDQAAWLNSFINGEDEALADPQQIPQDASGSGRGPATPAPGPGSAGHPLTADDIAAMAMDEYQAFRARIGMGNASGRGLFG